MDDLTVDQIIGIHSGIMEKSGGDRRLLSEGNLHEMVFRVNCACSPLSKAAMATFLLVAYPPFRDGNKRTARGVLEFILSQQGYGIIGDDGSLSELLQGVTAFNVEQEDIETWLCAHTQKTGQS
jgi:prophage maintenance system killer protein